MKTPKLPLFVGLGILFWFIAAMIIRYAGAAVFSDDNPMLWLFFVLAIPLTILFMYLTTLIAGVGFNQLLNPVVIMLSTATFLDGIALTWFRQLYSQSAEVALHGAAWILWGAGLGLLFAYYLAERNGKRTDEQAVGGQQVGVMAK